jgi:hypothetical protein
MRSFTGRSAFDETLPVADGLVEAGFGVDLEALKTDLEDWLTRKFGAGKQIKVTLTEVSKSGLLGDAASPAPTGERNKHGDGARSYDKGND